VIVTARARQLPQSRLEGKTGGALRAFREAAGDGAWALWEVASQLQNEYERGIQNPHDRGSEAWWRAFETGVNRLDGQAFLFAKMLRSASTAAQLDDYPRDWRSTDPLSAGLNEIMLVVQDLGMNVTNLHVAVARRDPEAVGLIDAVVEKSKRFGWDIVTSDFLAKNPTERIDGAEWESSLSRQALADRAATRLATAQRMDQVLG